MLRKEEILFNKPREYKLRDGSTILVRDPTPRDELVAYEWSTKHPMWDRWSKQERDAYHTICYLVQLLEEPKLSYEEFLKMNLYRLTEIVQIVGRDLSERIKLLESRNPLSDSQGVEREETV